MQTCYLGAVCEGLTYWTEGAKSNHCSINFVFVLQSSQLQWYVDGTVLNFSMMSSGHYTFYSTLLC